MTIKMKTGSVGRCKTTLAAFCISANFVFMPLLPASAESIRGKVVTLVSPNSAGGMMTRYARMIAPYLAKYSGAAEVRIHIMTGAGGIRGTNFVWFAEPDGTTIAFTSVPSLILAQLSGSEAVQFTATEFVYLGRAATEPRVLTVGATSGISSVAEAQNLNRPFVFPSQGTDEDFYIMAVLASALDVDLKVISGYNGNADTALAVIKGDGDGHITSWAASMAVINAGDERPILSLSEGRFPQFSEIPTATELVSGESRDAVQAIVNMLEMRRGFFGPPGLDAVATKELRDALSAALTDPELIAESVAAGLPLLPSPGELEQQKIDQITAASTHLIPILRAALDSIR
jgi:tripartite-type tricarboxylate transporter receptor subunit TctC